jgi:hypothetical protein
MDSNGEPTNSDLERMLNPSESEEEAAKRIFKEGLVPAAQAIVRIASYGTSESVQLNAAKYVIDRNLGPLALVGKVQNEDEWVKMMEGILRDGSS